MTDAIRHRGPDDEGHILVDTTLGGVIDLTRRRQYGEATTCDLALGNRRLSIIDLTPAGHQPMCNEDGTVWVTYNGEIYNHAELAAALTSQGHTFASHTDTEVVLHAYEQYGVDCVKHFNGMWAFALWDAKRKILFCSRDRFGEKPFYYFADGDVVVFASEIKGLLQHPSVIKKPNYRAVFDYVARGYGFTDVSDDTFFENIQKLPPAHSMVIGKGGVRLWRYWALGDAKPRPAAGEDDAVAEFGSMFRESVRLRLRSDVPVGFCLSGGLDSTSIACVASTLVPNASAFSSCAEDPRFDEREYIEPVLQATGLRSHLVFPEPNRLFDLLPQVIRAQEEPWSNPNIIAHWLLMEQARDHGVPVLLNGHGGDETLAGYPPHSRYFHAELLSQGRIGTFAAEVRADAAMRQRGVLSTGLDSLQALGRHWFNGVKDAAGVHRQVFAHLDPAFAEHHATRRAAPRRPFSSVLSNELVAGLESSPLPAWLRYEDHNSMAFSIETRQPFLDHRMVEFLFSIPDDLKIRRGVHKYILRRALTNVVPEKVRSRRGKLGFTTPAAAWWRGELKGPVADILQSASFNARGIFNTDEVLREFELHAGGMANRALMIWSWVNLELWFREFFT